MKTTTPFTETHWHGTNGFVLLHAICKHGVRMSVKRAAGRRGMAPLDENRLEGGTRKELLHTSIKIKKSTRNDKKNLSESVK